MFTVEQRHQIYAILYETDEIKIAVGEVARGRGDWEFHHLATSSVLKPDAKKQLTEFGRQQAKLRQITARMLK